MQVFEARGAFGAGGDVEVAGFVFEAGFSRWVWEGSVEEFGEVEAVAGCGEAFVFAFGCALERASFGGCGLLFLSCLGSCFYFSLP